MAKPTALDNLIAYFAPRAAARRVRDRIVFDRISKLGRKYEGAQTTRRNDRWHAPSTSANSEIGPALARLRNRSRSLVRDDTHASKGISVIATNVVDMGIVPTSIIDSERFKKKIDLKWKQWGESTLCDYNGQLTFYGMQKLAMRSIAEGGEMLLRRVWMPKTAGLPVPMQIQLLEADYIDLTKDGLTTSDGGFILQGVEFNKYGKRVAYWLFDKHPGENSVPFKDMTSKRIPAEDVQPVYRIERIGQVHGVPWIAPCIVKLRDFNDYDDAQLLRQKIASCFSAFVTDPDGEDLGEKAAGQKPTEDLLDRIEPGIIEHLSPGKQISFSDPPSVEGYAEFSRGHLRSVSSGLEVTYESLTGDYSQVNYSSARLAHLQMQAHVRDWQWNMFVPMFCQPGYRWFLEAAALTALGPTDDVASKWTTPRPQMIDPNKEITAKRDEVRAGFTTLPEAIREFGYDPEEQIKEMAEFNKKLDAAGIKLDSDPRYITQFGMEQPSNYTGKSSGGSSSDPNAETQGGTQ